MLGHHLQWSGVRLWIFCICRWCTVIICQLHQCHPELSSHHASLVVRCWPFSFPFYHPQSMPSSLRVPVFPAMVLCVCVTKLWWVSVTYRVCTWDFGCWCVCSCVWRKCRPFLLVDWHECLWGFALFRCASRWQLEFVCACLPACLLAPL